MIKAIIFDVCGVLSRGTFRESFSKLISQNYKIEKNRCYEVLSKESEQYLINKETQFDFLKRFAEILNIPFDYHYLAQLFTRSFVLNEELFELVKKLKHKYSCCIASDNYNELIEFLDKTINFSEHFEIILTSNKLGLRKKSEKFFEKILKKYNPWDCIYIDDREDKIKMGEKIGFKTIKFIDNQQVKKELEFFGVEV